MRQLSMLKDVRVKLTKMFELSKLAGALFFIFFINLLGVKAMTCPHVNH